MAHELLELRRLNITNNLIAYKPQSQYKLGSDAANLIHADSSIVGIADDNERGGWLFKKTATGGSKFNLYFYGGGVGEEMTLGHLSGLSAVVSIDNIVGNSSLPFFTIYTKPTGVGDVSWYKSKIIGTLNINDYISAGEKIQMYLGVDPPTYFGFRKIKTTKIIEGPGATGEEVWFITLQSNSNAAVGTQILVSDFTYTTLHNPTINRTIKLVS